MSTIKRLDFFKATHVLMYNCKLHSYLTVFLIAFFSYYAFEWSESLWKRNQSDIIKTQLSFNA